MVKKIITDNKDIQRYFSDMQVYFWDGTAQEFSVYILSDICNINKAVSMKLPVVIAINGKLEDYPVIDGTVVFESVYDIDKDFLEKFYNRFMGIPNVITSTKRLIIREICLDDLDALYEIYAEPDITMYMEGLYEREEEEEFTRQYIRNMYGFYGYGLWILEEKMTGKIIGRAGLSHRDVDGEVCIELGYVIGKPYQRQGYAYEACIAILEYAKKIGKTDVISCVSRNNLPSLKLSYKLGFNEYARVLSDDMEYIILKCNL